MKTAKLIEESKISLTAPTDAPKKRGNPKGNPANLVAPWPKGVSGNPGGRVKNDLAAEVARAVFSQNKEAIYAAMSKALLSGNAYSFDVIANRGYGKLKESKEVTHLHGDTPDSELTERIAQLERDLGLAREIDEAGRIGITQARAAETVVEPQDK